MNTTKKFDIVIFGASGFSAVFIIEELAKAEKPPMKWAISGRNKTKLHEALTTASNNTGIDLKDIPVLYADVKDEKSLKEVCSDTRLLINCVGPYLFYGEPVVKACIENGTDYIDLCGETLVLEKNQLKYNQQALESKVAIIGAAGFDSVLADMGVLYAQKQFDGQLDRIEAYCEQKSTAIKDTHPSINYATFLSAIMGFSNYGQLKEVRQKLMPQRLPFNKQYPMMDHPIIFKSQGLPPFPPDEKHHKSNGDGWCVPFPGTDKSVVTRTQYYFYEKEHKRPIQFRPYFKVSSLINALVTIVVGAVIFLMTRLSFTREILKKYPQYFTGGYVDPNSQPSRDDLNRKKIGWIMQGQGYTYAKHPEIKNDSLLQPNSPPDGNITVVVAGPDAYRTTALCATHVALTLLNERSKLPQPGGVLTTGVAFQNTNLIENLTKSGVIFDVVNK